MGTVDDYLAGLDDDAAAHIGAAYALARSIVPEAEEGLGYGMPALTYQGKPLLSVMRAARHIGLYPFSAEVIASLDAELQGVDHSKGTVRFPLGGPLPGSVVTALVRARRAEIEGP